MNCIFSALDLFINIYYQSDGCDKGKLSVSRDFLDLIFAFFPHKDGENIKQPFLYPLLLPLNCRANFLCDFCEHGVDFSWPSAW